MKNFFFTLSVIFTFSFGLSSQSFDCGGFSVDFGPVSCVDNGNVDPNDDYLSFTVTATVTDGNTGSGSIQFPTSVTVTDNMNNTDVTSNMSYEPDESPYSVQVPSDGCADVAFTIDLFGSNSSCQDLPGLLQVAPAAIPTLGQWGLIVLSLLITVIGLVFIRKRAFREAF